MNYLENRDNTREQSNETGEVIGEKLDRQFPVACLICETPMRRVGQDWPICLKCGLDQTGAEAYAIQRYND